MALLVCLFFALLLRALRAAAQAQLGSILLSVVEGLGCTSGSRGLACHGMLRPCPLRAACLGLPSPGQRGSAYGAAAPCAEDPAPPAS